VTVVWPVTHRGRQSTVHTQVLNRDTLDALPTGRTIQGLGQLVIGIALSIPDVGGSRAMQQTYMSTHGMDATTTPSWWTG